MFHSEIQNDRYFNTYNKWARDEHIALHKECLIIMINDTSVGGTTFTRLTYDLCGKILASTQSDIWNKWHKETKNNIQYYT